MAQVSRRAGIVRPEGLRITVLRKDEAGMWRATVHLGDQHLDVMRPYTCWVTIAEPRRELRRGVQAAMNDRLRQAEREHAKVAAA